MDKSTTRVDAIARAGARWATSLLVLFGLSFPAAAQLGTACTAEVLSRTVRVNADGSFFFSNLPTEDGNFRVRLTCTPDGSPVVHGATPFFQLVANQTVAVGPVAFGAVPPIPAVLELNLEKTKLTEKGERLFLGTTGILGDGTELDFSPVEMGTEFWSSDPRLANIELIPVAPGRTVAYLKANERGRVLIAARVEGVLTAVEIDLELPNDADRDGMTDEYEIAKGFNPNNPADALEDPDGDNLSNLQEFELGTDPRNTDTDADGLADDREIELGTLPTNPDSDGDGFVDSQEIDHGTNPLLGDSDGDGLLDGLEIAIESDPLVANLTTVVVGRVVDSEGVAVQGAAAAAYGRIVGTTDRGGAFTLGRVPADRGPIAVFARALRGGSALEGNSAPTAPIAGATTDVGTIQVVPMSSRVSGRVLDAFGRNAVPGVRVVARSTFDVRQTNTDATGVFTFDRMVPGMIRIEATDPRTGLRGRADVHLEPDGEAVATIVLGSFGSIEGRALGRDAVTPAGPGVIVRRMIGVNVAETTTTGADSTYRFAFVPLGGYTVETSNSQGDRGRTPVIIQATSQTVVADIAFLGRGTVNGVVETETGQPVPGAPVELSGNSIFEQRLSTFSAADGTFSLSGVFVGRFAVSATNPANGLAGTASGEIRNEADHDAVTIVVRATGTLVGTVFDFDGTTPVAGASVSVGIRSTTTDASGNYRLELLPLRGYTVSASHPTLPSCGSASTALTEPNQTVQRDITLRGTADLRVHVVYADGSPASAAALSLGGGFCTVERHGTADAQGEIVFAPLPVGSFSVEALGPIGSVRGSVSTELLPGEHGEVTIELEPVGTIAGHVFQSDGVTPVAGMTVNLVGGGRSQRSAADGSFRFDLVKVAGSPYTLQALDAQNVVLAEETGVVLHRQGELVERNLVLIPLGTVTGTVYGVDGVPKGGVVVGVSGALGRIPTRFATSDVNGIYRATRVAAVGAVTASARDALGFTGSGTGTLVGENAVATVDVHLNGEALVAELYDANNYVYPIEFPNGGVRDGELGLFNVDRKDERGGLRLELGTGGSFHRFLGNRTLVTLDRHEAIVEGDDAATGLHVKRRARVPQDGYFVRYIEELSNPTAQPITVDLRLATYMRFVANTRGSGRFFDPQAITATSSGDAELAVGGASPDRWVAFDVNLSGRAYFDEVYPSFGHVFDGPGGRVAVSTSSYDFLFGANNPIGTESYTRLLERWSNLTIPPGERALLLHFGIQETGPQAVRTAAERLVQLPPEAYEGLDASDLERVMNFAMNPAGTSTLPALPPLDGVIAGRVLEGDHATPVPGAAITYQSEHPLFQRKYVVGADSAGAYRVAGTAVNLGGRRVVPRTSFMEIARNTRTQQFTPTLRGEFPGGAPSVNLDLVFTGTGSVIGTVKRTDGNVVSFGDVVIRARQQLINLSAGLPAAGTFRFLGLPPDVYSLVATQPHPQGTGLKGAASARITGDGSEVLANITLDPVGGVFGTVRAGDGNVAPNLEVMMTSPTAPEFLRMVRTDTGGAYRFFDAPVGSYVLTVVEPITHIPSRVGVTIPENQNVAQDIELFGIGDIQVVARYSDGTPVPQGLVRLQVAPLGPNPVPVGKTDASGRLLIEDVPTGAFGIEVRHPRTPESAGSASGNLLHGGDLVTVEITVPVDHAPTVEMVSPLPGLQVVRGQSVLIQANALDDFKVASVEFAINGVKVGAVGTSPYRVTVPIDAPAGSPAEVRATAIDSGGNRTTAAVTIQVVADTHPPTVSITRPLSGTSAVEGTPVLVEAAPADDIRVARVELRANGALIKTLQGPPYQATYDVPSDLAPTATVLVPIAATVYDGAGNQQTASVILRVLPDRAPTITVTDAPADNVELPEGATIHFAATATDDVRVEVDLYLNGQKIQTRGGAPFAFNAKLPSLSAGAPNPVTYQLIARDSQGQTTAAPAIHVRIKADAPPTISLTAPADGADVIEGSTVAIDAAATDDVSLAKVELYVADEKIASLVAPPYHAAFQVASGIEGSRLEIRAVATDASGQTAEATATLTRRDDATPPAVSITSPADGASVALGATDVILAIDNSSASSVTTGVDYTGDGTAETILGAEIYAARQVLARLTPTVSRVAIVRAGVPASAYLGLTADFELVDQRLGDLLAGGTSGGSNLDTTLAVCWGELGSIRARRTASPLTILFATGGSAASEAELGRAVDAGERIHALDFGAIASPNLVAIATATGGASARVRSVADLGNALPLILSSGDQIAISADATDDVAVRAVTFSIVSADGSFDRTFVDEAPPFAASFTAPTIQQPLGLTVTATARDFGGNDVSSPPVSVTLAPGVASPQLVRLQPAAGTIGTTVQVIGRAFAPNPADDAVRFAGGTSGVPATVSSGNKFSLTVTVPAGAASGPVTVTVDGETSNGVAFSLDSDGDGLTDEQEVALGTNPNDRDTDDDGLEDGAEVNAHHTNPLLADSDGDGLNDGFEVRNGFDPLAGGEQGLDPDADGLTNLEEQTAGTDPNRADTDHDGLTDGAEVHTHHTNPTLFDTDTGGVDDGTEIQNGTNPLDSTDDAVSLPRTLRDGAGVDWQVREHMGSQGDPGDGGFAIYSSGFFVRGAFDLITDDLTNNRPRLLFGSNTLNRAIPEDGGRELRLGPVVRSGLNVSRKIFVPSDDSFVRYLEIFENPTENPVPVRAEITSKVGTEAKTEVVATSSGGTTFGLHDRFIVTDDADGTGHAAVAHVIAGPNAKSLPAEVYSTRLESAEPGDDVIDYAYRFVVPPGETRAILHFGVKNPTRAAVRTKVDQLLTLSGRALSGLSASEQAAVINFFAYADADQDGLADSDEAAHGADPGDSDSDDDELSDGFEVRYGFDPAAAGEQHLDPDGDGLDNLAEQDALADPTKADTDGDGLTDAAEVAAGTEASLADSDFDDLSDSAEISTHGTDPKRHDSDGGGVPDGPEIVGATDPQDPEDDRRVIVPPVETDGARWRWDLTSDARFRNGSDGAFADSGSVGFSGGFESSIDGLRHPSESGDQIYGEDGVREIVYAKTGYIQPKRTALWTRKIFIPKDDSFARILDIFEPPFAAPVDVELEVRSTLGSGSSTVLVKTGSGDLQFLPDDDWIVTDDLDAVGRPAIAHVLAGPTGDLRPELVSTSAPGGGQVRWTYRLHIPAGERRALLSFGVQRKTRAEALAVADRLARLAPQAPFGLAALSGLSPAEQGEIVNFFAYPDADLDRLSDADEARLGTDPNDPDTDGDGMTDGFEVSGGLDPTSPGDAHADPDGDGLDNLGEFAAHSLPNDPDTDDDGLSDGDEVLTYHSNPIVGDTDGDGLVDGVEVHTHHTSPTLADTDGGGRSDGDEVRDGTDPLNPADDFGSRALPTEMLDRDGFRWDVQKNGSILAGSLAFSGAARLEVNGLAFPEFADARTEPGGRELLIGPWRPTSGVNQGLQVTRKVFVPSDDTFARYLESIENTTDAPVVARLVVRTQERGAVQVLTTSSGDTTFDRADRWLSLDDDDGGSGDLQPPVALALAGPAARLRPDEASQSPALSTFAYEVRIPPHSRAIVMHFLTQQGSREEAAAKGADLEHLRGSARAGLEPDEPAEIENFFAFADLDFDGLADTDEATAGTDPANPDGDGDGLLDGFEARYGFDPLTAGEQHQDPDGDGLDNLAEQSAGTDPSLADTDGDGLSDGAEVSVHHTDPLDDDSDEGGRGDATEIQVDGTDPADGADDLRPATPTAFGTADGLGYRWILSETQGYVFTGPTNVFSPGSQLEVDNQSFYEPVKKPLGSPDQRLWSFGPIDLSSGLLASRKVYVPGDSGFARYVEVLENPTAGPISAVVQVNDQFSVGYSYLGTSSGDAALDAGDSWALFDDGDGSGAPAYLSLFAGPGGKVKPLFARTDVPGGSQNQFYYRITIPPGGKAALLHFLLLRGSRSDAATAASDLSRLPQTALAHLTAVDQAAIANFFAYLDSDGDLLSDDDEARLGTDPNRADTDGDGITDGYEVAHGLNPLSAADGAADPDGDGLANLEEATARTDPHVADTDGDGLLDGAEVHTHATDPTKADTDTDGLRDGREIELGTNPKLADTDGGGATDGEEIEDGTDPLVAADDAGAIVLDPDVADPIAQGASAAVDRDRNVHLIWHDQNSCAFRYSLRDRLGRAKIAATTLTQTCNGSKPSLAIDGRGVVHLTWSEDDGGGTARLWYARVDPSRDDRDGSAADPAAILTIAPRWVAAAPAATSSDLRPIVVADDVGVSHVAWFEERRERNAEGSFLTRDFLHATRISAGTRLEISDRLLDVAPYFDTARFAAALDDGGDLHLATGSYRAPDSQEAMPGLWYWMLDGRSNELKIAATRLVVEDTPAGLARLLARGDRVSAVFRSGSDSRQVLRVEVEPGRDDRSGDAADPSVIVVSGPTELPSPEPGPTTAGTGLAGAAFDRDGAAYLAFNSSDLFDNSSVDLLAEALGSDGSTLFPARSVRRRAVYLGGEEISGAAVAGTCYVPWVRREPTFENRLVLSVVNPDADGDGLANLGEETAGTDPRAVDTDHDGLRDGFEVRYAFNPLAAGEAGGDPDADALTNAQEQAAGTDPRRADTDGDGLSDGQEVNVLHTDPTRRDTDRDGLDDRDETLRGSDPNDVDSDGDGLPDGVEVERGTNPTSPADGAFDEDGDGLSAGEEYAAGTDPTAPDTDHDGLSDGDEVHVHHTDPTLDDSDRDGLADAYEIATSHTDPNLWDGDGGGRSDGQEVRFDGTNPSVAGDDLAATWINEYPYVYGQTVERDAAGNSHVFWLGGDYGELTYSMISPSGATLINDTELFDTQAFPDRPKSAVGPDGRLHLVWFEQEALHHLAIDPSLDDRDGSAADPATIRVQGPTTIGDPASTFERVDEEIAVGPDGRVHLAWVELATRGCCGNSEAFDQIHYQQLDAAGNVRLADRAVYECKAVRQQGSEQLAPTVAPRSHFASGSPTLPNLAVAADGSVHLLFTCEGPTDGQGLHELMLDGATGAVRIGATNLVPASGENVVRARARVAADGSVVVTFDRGTTSREVQLIRFQPALDDRDGSPANPATIVTLGPVTVTPRDEIPSDHSDLALDATGRPIVTFFEHPFYRLDSGLPKLVVAETNGVPLAPPIDLSSRQLVETVSTEVLPVSAGGSGISTAILGYDPDTFESRILLLRFTP